MHVEFLRKQVLRFRLPVPNDHALFDVRASARKVRHHKTAVLRIVGRGPHADDMNHLAHAAKVGESWGMGGIIR